MSVFSLPEIFRLKPANAIRTFLFAFFVLGLSMHSYANITVTAGTGGTLICANKAATGSTPAFTALSTITVAEGNFNDFGAGGTGTNTITLKAPVGWKFDVTSALTLAGVNATHFTTLTGAYLTDSTILVTVKMTNTFGTDRFTIAGIHVRATTAGAATANIVPTAITGTMNGLLLTTNFGTLSLTPALVPGVSISAVPNGIICPGTLVTFTAAPTNGGAPTYQWAVNGLPTAGATLSTDTSSVLQNGDTVTVTMTATGCVNPTMAVSNMIIMTVDPIPAIPVITGGGTSCGSTVITADNGGSGTMYFQGTNYNGTSTAFPATSEIISTAGTATYYFRAQSGGGCWGPQGSVTVNINLLPSAFTITPSASDTVCLGTGSTFTAGATPAPLTLLNQDFNSGLGGWSITNIAGNATSYWQIWDSPAYNSATGGDGSPMIEAAPDAAGAGNVTNTILTSPSFSLAGYASATLTFNQYYRTYFSDSTVDVEYSVDGGTVWTPFMDEIGTTTGTTTWTVPTPTTTVALPAGAIGQPNVMLRWNYKSLYGWYWAVDNINVTAVPVLTYSWVGISGATGLSCGTCTSNTITPAVTGTNVYSVSTTAGGCTTTSGVTIEVNPLPVVAPITGITNLCIGAVTTLMDDTLSGVWTSTDPSIAAVDAATGAITTTAAGITSISYTVTNAFTCSTTVSTPDTVTAYPVVDAITGLSEVCKLSSIALADDSLGGVWNSSDMTVATVDAVTGMLTGVDSGTVMVSYTITQGPGCATTVTAAETVNPIPVVNPITGDTNVCAGLVMLESDSTPGGVWSSSDTTVATVDTGLITGIMFGTSMISYTVTNSYGCAITSSTMVSIGNPMPASSIMPVTTITLCHGIPVPVWVTTVGSGLTYQWTHNTNAISGATDSVYNADSTGFYTAIIDNGTCHITLGDPAHIIAPPNPIIGYNTTGNFLYTGSFSSYQWYLNGVAISSATGSVLPAPYPGIYTVKVTDGNGCDNMSAPYTITGGVAGVNNTGTVENISVYPNPAASVLHIDAPVKVNITVIAADGRTVITQNDATNINVEGLANGVYLVMIYGENNILLKTAKFSKID